VILVILILFGGVGGYRYRVWQVPYSGGGLSLVVLMLIILVVLGYL
jgi:hypothetical protein